MIAPSKKKTVPDTAGVLALVEQSLDDDKALDVIVVDLAGKTEIADYMVVATGTSQRHVGSTADHLREKLKAAGLKNIAVEGEPACDWVLIDAGDVVVHLFRAEVREFYNLEKMWTNPRAHGADVANASV